METLLAVLIVVAIIVAAIWLLNMIPSTPPPLAFVKVAAIVFVVIVGVVALLRFLPGGSPV